MMEENKNKKQSRFFKAWLSDGRGGLSTTRFMNFIFFIMAISLFIAGLIASLIYGKDIDAKLYAYVGGLCGGSFLQYSYAKVIRTKENNNNTPGCSSSGQGCNGTEPDAGVQP